ncbi:MAG: Calx-beta domain-containing protein [Kofleriaceae bacterium]
MLRRVVVSFIVLTACKFSAPLATDAGEVAPPKVSFEFLESGADEVSGTVRLPVVLSAPSDGVVTVAYVVDSGGGATPGADFTVASNLLTFAPGEVIAEIPVTITDDADETEVAERFSISLMSPQGADLGKTTTHTITIADHVLPRIQFSAPTTAGSEDAPSTIMLVLDKASEGQSTVVIGVAAGIVTPGDASDVGLAEGTLVTIPAGAMQVAVPVLEVNDTLDEEDNENLLLSLKGASPNLFVGAQAVETHAIADNDLPPVVQFASAGQTVEEGVGTLTIAVSLSTASGRQVRVTFDRAAGTSEPADATLTNAGATLTFAPGEVAKEIAVTIANDTVDEDPETVPIELAGAVNATLGTATHTITINADAADPKPRVEFVTAAANRDERDENRNFDVKLVGATERIVTVPYSVNGASTASSPSDYTLAASPLEFAPGTTTKSIVFDMQEDSMVEPDETVIIDLEPPTNATLGTIVQFTFSIDNDD